MSVLCVVKQRSLRRADHPSREVLPRVVCLAECVREALTRRRPWPTMGCGATIYIYIYIHIYIYIYIYERGVLCLQCKECVLEAPWKSPIDSPGFHIPQVEKHNVSGNTVSHSSGQKMNIGAHLSNDTELQSGRPSGFS